MQWTLNQANLTILNLDVHPKIRLWNLFKRFPNLPSSPSTRMPIIYPSQQPENHFIKDYISLSTKHEVSLAKWLEFKTLHLDWYGPDRILLDILCRLLPFFVFTPNSKVSASYLASVASMLDIEGLPPAHKSIAIEFVTTNESLSTAASIILVHISFWFTAEGSKPWTRTKISALFSLIAN